MHNNSENLWGRALISFPQKPLKFYMKLVDTPYRPSAFTKLTLEKQSENKHHSISIKAVTLFRQWINSKNEHDS